MTIEKSSIFVSPQQLMVMTGAANQRQQSMLSPRCILMGSVKKPERGRVTQGSVDDAPAASTILAVTSLPAASVVSSIAESTAQTAPESTVLTHPAETTAPSNTVVGPSVESVKVPETEEDPDLVDPTEEIVEGTQEEDAGFDVVENITSDVYQKRREECERKKLELIESCSPVTCKSGSNELVWVVIPDSIAEEPHIEFPTIGVREMEWGKFADLAAFGKASLKGKVAMERPQPYLDLLLTLWAGDWVKQLQQLNSAIEKNS